MAYLKKCTNCGFINKISLYQTSPTSVFVTYDIKNRLPMKVFELNLKTLVMMAYYNVPNFGMFVVGINYSVSPTGYIMLYHPLKKITEINNNETRDSATYIIDGQIIICCLTDKNELKFITDNGKIIDMENTTDNSYDTNILTFNTPYGTLTGGISNPYGQCPHVISWTFAKTESGMKTKPAIRPADD